MSLSIPRPCRYGEAKDFFRDFLEENRKIAVKYSVRFLAKRLRWPASYLTDLVAGRRRLTLNRALEFAATFEMSASETHELVRLALLASQDELVRKFAVEIGGRTLSGPDQELRPLPPSLEAPAES